MFLLRGPHKDSLAHKLTCSNFAGTAAWKAAGIYIQRGAELMRFRVRAGRAEVRVALSGDGKQRQEPLALLIEPSPDAPSRHRWVPTLSSPLTWLE